MKTFKVGVVICNKVHDPEKFYTWGCSNKLSQKAFEEVASAWKFYCFVPGTEETILVDWNSPVL